MALYRFEKWAMDFTNSEYQKWALPKSVGQVVVVHRHRGLGWNWSRVSQSNKHRWTSADPINSAFCIVICKYLTKATSHTHEIWKMNNLCSEIRGDVGSIKVLWKYTFWKYRRCTTTKLVQFSTNHGSFWVIYLLQKCVVGLPCACRFFCL